MKVIIYYQILLFGLSATESDTAEPICMQVGDLRLIGGRSALEGRVEVCNEERVWNRICNDGWDNNDARVVCRQLGLSPLDSVAVTQRQLQQFQTSTADRFLFSSVDCRGSEYRLVDCNILRHYPNINCDSSGIEDAGVRCTNDSLIKNVTVTYLDKDNNRKTRISWKPISNHAIIIDKFEINCFYWNFNTKHIAQSMVSRGNVSVELNGLVPSASYDCCVSAVLDGYVSTNCTHTMATTSMPNVSYSDVTMRIFPTEMQANGTSIAVAILSFFVILLFVLLTIAVLVLVYFIFLNHKQTRYRFSLITKSSRDGQLTIEGNPSYSTVNISKDFVGESFETVPTYEVVNTMRMDVDKVQDEEKNEYEEIKEPKTFSSGADDGFKDSNEYNDILETTSFKLLQKHKLVNREGEDTNSLQPKSEEVNQLEVDSNPSYSTIPEFNMPVSEYSLAGPDYFGIELQKTLNFDDGNVKTQHEIRESKEDHKGNNKERQGSSTLTGSVCCTTDTGTVPKKKHQLQTHTKHTSDECESKEAGDKHEGHFTIPFTLDKERVDENEDQDINEENGYSLIEY